MRTQRAVSPRRPHAVHDAWALPPGTPCTLLGGRRADGHRAQPRDVAGRVVQVDLAQARVEDGAHPAQRQR
eukprot:820530-Pleurochrysis_carterae.AAC.3